MEMESDDLTTASGEGKTEETKDSTTTIISSEPQVIKREKSASISSDVSSTPASPALSDKKKVRDKSKRFCLLSLLEVPKFYAFLQNNLSGVNLTKLKVRLSLVKFQLVLVSSNMYHI
jgi:hypothetical protein